MYFSPFKNAEIAVPLQPILIVLIFTPREV